VKDEYVDRIQARILQGMGLIMLHSGHMSKIFRRMMGTSCCLCWRDVGEKSNVWVANPYHPITQGIDAVIEIPNEEMYGEYFDVATPDDVVFISWFQGGNVFRSGMTWHRGRGKIFYFQPGHETYPIYLQEDIMKIITNAVRWAGKFEGNVDAVGILNCPNVNMPIEPIPKNEKKSEK
jgi:trehalose utilization protein